MSVLTLRPNYHIAIPYSFTPQTVHYRVESELETTVHVLNEDALTQFRGGTQYHSYRTSARLNLHQGDLQIAGSATWYLVVANYNAEPTAIYYHVWSR